MPPVLCPHCQSSNRQGARFCNECGGRLPAYVTPPVRAPESPDHSNQPWLQPDTEPKPKLASDLVDQPWLDDSADEGTGANSSLAEDELPTPLLRGLSNLLPRSDSRTLLGLAQRAETGHSPEN